MIVVSFPIILFRTPCCRFYFHITFHLDYFLTLPCLQLSQPLQYRRGRVKLSLILSYLILFFLLPFLLTFHLLPYLSFLYLFFIQFHPLFTAIAIEERKNQVINRVRESQEISRVIHHTLLSNRSTAAAHLKAWKGMVLG
jgi:predicted membrane protein